MLKPGHSGCPIIIDEPMILAGAAFQLRDGATDFEVVLPIMEVAFHEKILESQEKRIQDVGAALATLNLLETDAYIELRAKTSQDKAHVYSQWNYRKSDNQKGYRRSSFSRRLIDSVCRDFLID